MKQKILLMIFALWLLGTVSSRQIFALAENRAAAQDSTPIAPTETAVSLTNRLNDYRTDLDLPAYYQDQALVQAAQWVADTMAATEFISHYDENGANPQQRAEKAGYDEHVTEIIFGGFGGVEAAWEWWTDNELHHSLLISEDYMELGVATAVSEQSGRQYWVIMFGFGDGEYDTEEPAEQKDGKNNAPPTATTTAAATAVEATSTVPLPDPTATTEQVALATDREINNPTSANPDTAATPTQANANSPRESQWLIIAAVGTIIFSIAIFYFPRHGLSQKFKERT